MGRIRDAFDWHYVQYSEEEGVSFRLFLSAPFAAACRLVSKTDDQIAVYLSTISRAHRIANPAT